MESKKNAEEQSVFTQGGKERERDRESKREWGRGREKKILEKRHS